MDRHDILGVVGAAARSLLGWAVVIVITMLTGVWLGTAYGHDTWLSADQVCLALVLCTFAWLMFPMVLLAIAASALGWYLPLRVESAAVRVAAAALSFLAWFAIAAWVLP